MLSVSLLIGGEARQASDARVFERCCPVTGEIVSRAASATPSDAADAVTAAAAAFYKWSRTGPSQRRDRLMQAASVLESRSDELRHAMAMEIGATRAWADFNVHLSAMVLREAASLVTHITGSILPSDTPGMEAYAIRQPVGVVLGLAAWNAPLLMGVRAIAAPLACGNTVVLKASELCPATHRLIGEIMDQAGLGAGVVNVVTNAVPDAGAIVESLVGNPAVRRVNFTGSTRVGRTIAELAAKYLKPVLLELGGKAAMIVLDDADVDEAVRAAAFGAFMNQGQLCMSTERIVVDSSLADAFAEKLAAKAASLVAGESRKAGAALGPVISIEAAERITDLVRDAVMKGARILAGGGARGVCVDATVVDHVTPMMRLYYEESFGPVVAIIRVEGEEEAIRVANDSEYGLSSAVFGRNVRRAFAVAQRLETGMCHINGPTVHDEAHMPFGGMKASGHGRFGGEAAIHEFTELRWITVSTKPRDYRQ
jgi:acyl-CoA reductase-like NAD-dependent aldehyde dehydrogenase